MPVPGVVGVISGILAGDKVFSNLCSNVMLHTTARLSAVEMYL